LGKNVENFQSWKVYQNRRRNAVWILNFLSFRLGAHWDADRIEG
jgi:hypothetical protein